MKIPAEAIPPIANVGREIEGDKRVEPVNSLARLASDVLASPQEETPSSAPGATYRPRAATAAAGHQAENPLLPVERRRAERRVENRPVLIDTRSNRGRRRGVDDARINIKV
mgnify:FL=1